MRKSIILYIALIALFNVTGISLIESQSFVDNTMDKADSIVQSYKHTRADKNFDNMAYIKAIEKYEDLLEKEIGGDTLKSHLAIAYYKVGKTEKAEPLFKQVVNGADYKPDDLYFYSQTLKYNEKYKEADKWMNKYREVKGTDSRSEIQYEAAPKIFAIVDVDRYSVEEVNFNSSQSDFGAVLLGEDIVFSTARNDERVIRREYAWNETPYLDIYHIKKDAGVLSNPKLLSGKLSSAFHDGPACFTTEGNDVYFTRNNYSEFVPKNETEVVEHVTIINKALPKKSKGGVNNLMIMHATKDADGDWNYPESMPFNSTEYSCGHSCLSPDNQTMYFASDMPGGFGGSDIYKINKTDDGWGEPINMGADINTEGEEMFPFIHANEHLYFCSNGQLTLGGLDVFVALKKGDGYQVKNMGFPLNSSKDDFSFFLEEDNVHGYFASNRPGGTGDDDIYRFTITDPISFSRPLNGRLIDANSKLVIRNTSVELKDNKEELIGNLITDDEGMISTDVDEITSIIAKVNVADYFPYLETFEITDDVTEFVMVLKPRPYYGIYGTVFLLPDMTPVSDVTLRIEQKSGEKLSIDTGTEGNFRTKLEPNTAYDLVFTKKQFFTSRVEYTTVGKDTGYVNLNEYVELEMEEATVGKSIEIEVLYDLGKWDIREDAAVELNDMIQFMEDNPTIKIEMGSHTDARGSNSSNQRLAQKRAQSAVDYMVGKGISQDRMTAKGYGEEKLKNRCADGVRCSEEEHQENRRTEVTIVAM